MIDLEKPVENLGDFVQLVNFYRSDLWGTAKHKELWFRGEGGNYRETFLRPKLYRPEEGKALKPDWKLLQIENDLHDEFRRIAVERVDLKTCDEDWDWDSYFLMQHHNAPTRLLDWSDGALIALHFAIRDRAHSSGPTRVFVLEPYRLVGRIDALPEVRIAQEAWKSYLAKHPSLDLDDDDWDSCYLPCDETERAEISLPPPPLVLEFPQITRRIAAQRGRFIVLGTDPSWLANEFERSKSTTLDPTMRVIEIDETSRPLIRQQLRDCGITESVIYPDLDGLGREIDQLWQDRRNAPEENG